MNLNNEQNNKELKRNNNDISSLNSSKLIFRKIFNLEDQIHDKVKNNSLKISKKNSYYIKKKLFPYKYYLCSIFMKNIGISKKSFFFTENFVDVYKFVCQLIDITSYIILQKEFQILKNTLLIRKYKTAIENTEKININDKSFYKDIKDCLQSNKFTILGKLTKNKDKK